jgi:biopolymer transport protein ExbD
MRLPKRLPRAVKRISLTPLIDIVFILLLFFILESNFLRFGELALNIPGQDQPGESATAAIELQVFDNGQIWLDGQTLKVASFDAYLKDRKYAAQTPVFIRAQDTLPIQMLVNVVDILQRHSLSKLQILPLQE